MDGTLLGAIQTVNLIEQAGKVMDENVHNNVFFEDEKSFVATIESFFKTGRNKAKASLSSRITDDVQVLKAAF